MTFPYEEITPQVFRPIIPIILISDTRFVFYQALVDSGADYCIFSLETAYNLGIDLKDEDRTEFRGAGRETIKGFWGEIKLRIGEKTYETQVIFAEISDFGHGILGQKGFFDHFDVKLSYHQQLIDIKSVNNP